MSKKSSAKVTNRHYHSDLRRLDEQDGGAHQIDIILDAARRHDEDRLRYLAAAIDINQADDGKNALFWLAGEKDVRAVQLLIAFGLKVNAIVEGAATPLMHAAYRNQLQVVRFLVQSGAQVDYQDTNGDSALSIAIAEGHLEIIQFLQEYIN